MLIHLSVEQLIPQRYPIILIDRLEYSGDAATITSFVVPQEHLFVQQGVLREPGIIENIAQTAAARAGYESKSKGLPVPLGFIGDVSKLEIVRLPASGALLKTTVTPLQQVFDITLIKGTVEDAQGVVAHCEMKIVLNPTN